MKTTAPSGGRLRRGFTLVELLVVITVIAILAAIAIPTTQTALRTARGARETSNLKQVVSSLGQFKADTGVFPGQRYADNQSSGEGGGSVNSSNDAFRQLFEAGVADQGLEPLFWVEGAEVSPLKPDGKTTGSSGEYAENETLKSGNVGWAYVHNLPSSPPSNAPLAMDALASGGSFPAELRGKKILAGFVDSSVTSVKLDNSGKAMLPNGEDITNVSSAITYGNPQQGFPTQILQPN